MFRNLVFVVGPKPFDARDEKRYGIRYLTDAGFCVQVMDCSVLLDDTRPVEDVPEVAGIQGCCSIATIADLESSLCGRNPGETLVICAVFCNSRADIVWDTIRKTRLPVASCTLGTIPLADESSSKILRYISKSIKAPVQNLSSWYRRLRYPVLSYWLVSGASSVREYRKCFRVKRRTQIIWAHNFDYDIYLAEKDREIRDDFVVFIDQNFLEHPDYDRLGLKRTVTPERFQNSINGLLESAERETATEVVIAAHPTSNVDKLKKLYGGRTVYGGRTADLIRRAKLVIAHSSTATQVAILYRKPIALFTTTQLDESHLRNIHLSFSKRLGKDSLNADGPYGAEVWKSHFSVDEGRYSAWIDSYIKCAQSPEMPIWHIFAQAILTNDSRRKDK